MAKKILQSNPKKIKNKFQTKEITNEQLKTLAIKKIREMQNKEKKNSKISKTSFHNNLKSRQQTMVQKQLFEQILDQSTFECPVCLQLMIEPTLLQCGHAYCFKCLEELMIYKSCCGVCRNVQNESQFQRSKNLQTMIESMILKKSQNYLDYYCRVTDTENWKRVRNISIQQLAKGMFIDFRDRELKWRKAQILKITYNEVTGHYDMVVKYKKDGQENQQTIQSDSGRYTKFSYYTKMKYLEPRTNNNNLIQQFVQGQVMDIPFIGVESRNQIDMMGLIPQSYQNQEIQSEANIEQQSHSEFENYFGLQDEFLDELFHNNQNQPTDLIQLLA